MTKNVERSLMAWYSTQLTKLERLIGGFMSKDGPLIQNEEEKEE